MDRRILTIFFLLVTSTLLANEQEITEALKAYKTGEYKHAIDTLEKIKNPNETTLQTKFYLQGLSYSRIQEYDKAVTALSKAITYKNPANDLYFEYGQALYANNDLEKSREAFKKSYKVKYKVPTSLYYIGHISQLLEQHKEAKKAFEVILKTSKDDPKMLQVARFQLAESLLAMAEKRDDSAYYVEKYVIPQMKIVSKLDSDSQVGKDADSRIDQLKKRYFLDPNYMKNGRVIPDKKWNVDFSQKASYDNNVTLSTDVPTSAATRRGSYIYETGISADYTIPFKNRYIFKPNFDIENTYHSDRVNSAVYRNDEYNITMGSDNSYEHTLLGKRASLIFNYDFNYAARDNYTIKERKFTSRAHTFTLGEKFRYFDGGPTRIKLKYKDYTNYLPSFNNKTKTISVDQIIITPSAKLWVLFFQADFLDAYNQDTNSTNNYLFRVDYIDANFLPTYTLNLAASVALLDTKLQSASRGLEKTYSPSAKITKRINDNLSFIASYEYTRKTSKNKTSFDYSKHVTTFELAVNF